MAQTSGKTAIGNQPSQPIQRVRDAFIQDDQIPTHVVSLGVGRINRKTQVPFTPEQRGQFALNNAIRFATEATEEGHAYVAVTNQRLQATQLIVACATHHPVVYDVSFGFADRETGAPKTGHRWAVVVGKDLDRDGLLALRALTNALQSKVWLQQPGGEPVQPE